MALMIGTSGALRVLWETEPIPPPAGLWRYRLDRRRIIIGGALSDGGNLVRWLRANLALGKSKELLDRVAEVAPDSHGLTVLPFLAGERGTAIAPMPVGPSLASVLADGHRDRSRLT